MALKNPKWEAFAQALSRGAPQTRAYVEAGFKPHPANPATYAKKPEIAARVAELVAERESLHEEANAKAAEQFVAETQLDQAAILAKLQRIAEICDGSRTIKKTVADDNGKTREVEISHLDMNQARQAWEAIGRQTHNMFQPRTRADVNLNGVPALDPDTRAKIAALVSEEIPAATEESANAGTDAQASPDSIH